MSPNCSIIIPTRNCLKYLRTAIATINLQLRDDLEIIVIDDGSTDGTAAWLRAGTATSLPLRILETGGIGPARARNAGLEISRGGLIAFLDADDAWWPGKLDAQLAFHERQPDAVFSFTDYIHQAPDGLTLGTSFGYWRCPWTPSDGAYVLVSDAESKLLATNVVGTSTVVARRSALQSIGGFSTQCKSAEDWDLWLRLAGRGPVGCSGAVTMTYLMRPDSETAARPRRLEAMTDIIARYEGAKTPAVQDAVRLARARIDTARAELARSQGRPFEAARAHATAFIASPDLRVLRSAAKDVVSASRAVLRRSKASQ